MQEWKTMWHFTLTCSAVTIRLYQCIVVWNKDWPRITPTFFLHTVVIEFSQNTFRLQLRLWVMSINFFN
jgi:hypothetical protein